MAVTFDEFDTDLQQTAQSMRRLMRGFTIISGLLVFGVGGWAVTAEVESAVIASGKFVVKSSAQEVQHLEGGTVGAILVSEGDLVRKGQVVVRLDGTRVGTELAILERRLVDLTAEEARLIAERDDKSSMTRPKPPFDMKGRSTELDLAVAMQQTLLSARRAANRSQLSQLEERKRQTEDQILGLKRVRRARVSEMEQTAADLKVQRGLDRKRLIRRSVLRQTIRQYARVQGDIGDIDAKISAARSRLAETTYRIAELKRDNTSKTLDRLKVVQSQIAETREKRIAADDRSTNLEIRAPRAGIVHEVKIHTVGGVIRPGQTVMSVIPQSDPLIVKARIATHEVDQVNIGQEATVRISAFKQRITPELTAKVVGLSPDESKDERSGQAFFSAKISIAPEERKKLGGKQLTPGLPAEVFIRGQSRTVMSYLTQPLFDQFRRVFHEE